MLEEKHFILCVAAYRASLALSSAVVKGVNITELYLMQVRCSVNICLYNR